jgi:hypothetical protein
MIVLGSSDFYKGMRTGMRSRGYAPVSPYTGEMGSLLNGPMDRSPISLGHTSGKADFLQLTFLSSKLPPLE